MVGYDEALAIMLSVAPSPTTERVPLAGCLGRVVAKPVYARIDLPPFTKAAMDGFAVSSGDRAGSFTILETIAAGDTPGRTVSSGTCCRIMTGAMMPEGADSVVRVEFTSEQSGVMRIERPEGGANVILQGENVGRGEVIFAPGIIEARHIGIFAEQGFAELAVQVPPLVGIVTTGSELRTAGESLSSGEIYDSNGPQLRAQVETMRAGFRDFGIVRDDEAKLREVIEEAIAECGVVVLTGGVSMGEFDYVPRILEAIGAEIAFHGVSMKPGRPLLFARKDGACLIALPGNPVSTFVIFELMVKPLIYRLMGLSPTPAMRSGMLTEEIARRDAKRTEFRPVVLAGSTVAPVRYHGSSHLHALGSANGLIRIDAGVTKIEKGTVVDARSI